MEATIPFLLYLDNLFKMDRFFEISSLTFTCPPANHQISPVLQRLGLVTLFCAPSIPYV